MSNINFTQFSTPTDTIPSNDYVVGYHETNGTKVEAKWNMLKLASESLPNSGLSTRNHQIRQLAKRNYENTYSFAAITRKEEVVCWGQNIKSGPPNIPSTADNQKYTKFGAGFPSTNRASVWQPVVIPFIIGQPNDANQDIYNLQKNNLTIIELHWDIYGSIARLSDGSVWIKCLLGSSRSNGIDFSNQPTSLQGEYFSAAYYKITNWSISTGGSDIIAKHINSFPILPTFGGLYLAIDQHDDLHVWGEGFGATSTIFGSNLVKSSIPMNVSNSGGSELKQKIAHAQITGSSSSGNINLSVITTENKLFSIGHNATGVIGDQTFTPKTAWTRSNYEPTGGAIKKPVDNAERFLESKYQTNIAGYISTIAEGQNYNQIYLCGHNAVAGDLVSPPALTLVGANAVYKPYATSNQNDQFVKGFINNSFTAVVMTRKGYVMSAGRNADGSGGRQNGLTLALGSVFNNCSYKLTGQNQTMLFGIGISAIDIEFDRTASTNNCTAILTIDNAGKQSYYLAGHRTFTSQYISYIEKDSVFRKLPIQESAIQIALGGETNNHQWTFVLTDTCRTYGIGYGSHDFIQSSWDPTNSWTNGWSPQPSVIF